MSLCWLRIASFCLVCLFVSALVAVPVTAQTSATPEATPFVLSETADAYADSTARDAASTRSSRSPARLRVESRATTQTTALPDAVRLYYVAGDDATLYNLPGTSAPLGKLDVRTTVERLSCDDGWCHVRADDGRDGFVEEHAISNVWIHVSKRDRRLYLYRGPHRVKTFKADFGYNAFSDKERQGSTRERDHYRTPEGLFYVVHRNPNSESTKALVLNYPTVSDAEAGLNRGLISRSEYRAIVRAQERFVIPPMNTDLGGWIEIHGDGTGAATNWTYGCVALHNRDMNRLWWWAQVGTPVLVE